jgi:NTP pyrophosphatase (non-canonical NTP hydrolase)
MLMAEYAAAVDETDQFNDRPIEERRRISILGLASEIGSVVSAVKKRKLGEGGPLDTSDGLLTRHELREELGDVMWYCFALSRVEEGEGDDVLADQLKALKSELEGDSPQSEMFRGLLTEQNLEAFREKASAFPSKLKRRFSDFQDTAFLTARSQSDELVDISLAVLMQLAAQLMRLLMPDNERQLHEQIGDRAALDILGKIAWHIAAIAKVYGLTLDEIAAANIEKANLRRSKERPTPLHDEECPDPQRLPRKFEVKFLTIGENATGDKRSRMYLGVRQLGDDLTDNSYDPDGYRFHDVLHLAHVAHLGWSPVMRQLMKRKRKDDKDPKVDEVEDGARARIVEEAILKVIHSEGADIAEILHPKLSPEDRPLFEDGIDIPLSFFKLIGRYVKGLEVGKNSFEEWKAAIRDGHQIYQSLVKEGQGTVSVDLDARTISFRPEVYVDIPAAVAGVGSCAIPLSEFDDDAVSVARGRMSEGERGRFDCMDATEAATVIATKRAILQSVGINAPGDGDFLSLSLTLVESGKFSAKAKGPLQNRMWDLGVIAFKTSVARSQNSVYCTALACCDPPKA